MMEGKNTLNNGSIKGPADWAAEKASDQPMFFKSDFKENLLEKYPFFMSIAYYLHRSQTTGYILLPVKQVGALIGVDPNEMGGYRKQAKEDGFLEVLAQASPELKLATRFKFNIEKVYKVIEKRKEVNKENSKKLMEKTIESSLGGTNPKGKATSIRLPFELWVELKTVCSKQNTSMRTYASKVLKAHLLLLQDLKGDCNEL